MVTTLLVTILFGCDHATTTQPSAGDRGATTQLSTGGEVTVYCSVDREFAEPILAEFERRNSIKVHRIYDTEAGKTTGLLNRLIAEKARPRADVWWSSEIFGTIQLAEQGIFAEYRPPTAVGIPEQFKDPAGRWTAFGLRGRVLAYDPKRTRPENLPKRWVDLAMPKYHGKICMADPRFGTTRGHVAAMHFLWGTDDMHEYLDCLRKNFCRLTDGNAQSVLMLARGTVEFAATDTDDVVVAQQRGDSIEMIYPDLSPFGSGEDDEPWDMSKTVLINMGIRSHHDQISGTLWIPNTVAVIGIGPNPASAKSLADYLVSAEVEEKLALSQSRNVPVRDALRAKLKISATHAANVNYSAIAKKLDESDQLIRDILLK